MTETLPMAFEVPVDEAKLLAQHAQREGLSPEAALLRLVRWYNRWGALPYVESDEGMAADASTDKGQAQSTFDSGSELPEVLTSPEVVRLLIEQHDASDRSSYVPLDEAFEEVLAEELVP